MIIFVLLTLYESHGKRKIGRNVSTMALVQNIPSNSMDHITCIAALHVVSWYRNRVTKSPNICENIFIYKYQWQFLIWVIAQFFQFLVLVAKKENVPAIFYCSFFERLMYILCTLTNEFIWVSVYQYEWQSPRKPLSFSSLFVSFTPWVHMQNLCIYEIQRTEETPVLRRA